MTKLFPSLLGVVYIALALTAAGSAQAGFDWVTPETQKTAPVAAVERTVLPPPTGIAGSETPPVYAAPVAEPVYQPAPGPTPVYIPRSVPVPPDTASASTQMTVPTAVYPPPGNSAAQPLSGTRTWEPASPLPVRTLPPRTMTATTITPAPVATPASSVVTMSSSAPAPIAVADEANTPPRTTVDGFGTNIPLSLAIEQVVPSSYTVVYQTQLDPDTIVSWVGGRAWDKVLEDMVYAHGARVRVTGAQVILYPPTAAPIVIPAPVVVSAPTKAPVAVSVPPVMAPDPLPARVVNDVSAVPAMPPGAGPAPVAARPRVSVVEPTVQTVDVMAAAPSSGNQYDPSQVDIFSGRTGETVRDILVRWGRIAHVNVAWQMDQDLTLPHSFAVNAPFPRAVEKLFDLYRGQAVVPSATIVPGPTTTMTVRTAAGAPSPASPGFSLE